LANSKIFLLGINATSLQNSYRQSGVLGVKRWQRGWFVKDHSSQAREFTPLQGSKRQFSRRIAVKDNKQPRVWTTRTYDRLAKYYDFFMRVAFRVGEKGRERIVGRLGVGSILDVACGTGTLLTMAHEKGLECYGIDLSQGMLDQARAKVPDAELRKASFYEIPYPDERFDYVAATNALSGTYIDVRPVLLEMIRVCKRGGGIYIAEWPKAERETLLERLVVRLASLNDDAPKDYQGIFRELGYEPEVEVLSKRYHVFGIEKK
jgi:ubiquinone/menaquinone biosynthesis C-methylase UbiE